MRSRLIFCSLRPHDTANDNLYVLKPTRAALFPNPARALECALLVPVFFALHLVAFFIAASDLSNMQQGSDDGQRGGR